MISGILLAILIANLDTEAALNRVAQADPTWIMASFVMGALLLLARAVRFRLLTTQAELPTVTAAISVQTFINQVLHFVWESSAYPIF